MARPGTATFLFTDIEDSTRLWEERETSGDHPAWHKSETDVLPGKK